jgi:hypothetical protein
MRRLFLIFAIWVQSNCIAMPSMSLLDTPKVSNDKLYQPKKILKKFAKKLNYLSKYYKDDYPSNYTVTSETFYNFYIVDLVDTTNNTAKKDKFYFQERHIYLFSSLNYNFLYCNICFIQNGELYYFLSLNCKNSVDKIENVIEFANTFLAGSRNKDVIIDRIRNYKKYIFYYKIDNFSYPFCE